MTSREKWMWARACGLVLVLLQCRTLPDDPDRAPGLARELRIGTQHRDVLECPRGDCADWYRVYVGKPGTLLVTAESQRADADQGLEMFLGDARARILDRTRWTRRGELQFRVTPGYYFIRIDTQSQDAIPYLLRTGFEPRVARAPVPPTRPLRPKLEAVRGRIVEIESNAGAAEAVIFKLDRADRLELGLRGRLLREGEVIADLEVVEVYSGGGARARLLGTPTARIDASTEIVIDVRADRR